MAKLEILTTKNTNPFRMTEIRCVVDDSSEYCNLEIVKLLTFLSI